MSDEQDEKTTGVITMKVKLRLEQDVTMDEATQFLQNFKITSETKEVVIADINAEFV